MKSLLLAAALLLPHAATADALAEARTTMCMAFADNATEVMGLRQNAYPMSDALAIQQAMFADKGEEMAFLSNALQQVIIMAYKEPLWSTEKHKKQAISEFSSKVLIECLQNFQR